MHIINQNSPLLNKKNLELLFVTFRLFIIQIYIKNKKQKQCMTDEKKV